MLRSTASDVAAASEIVVVGILNHKNPSLVNVDSISVYEPEKVKGNVEIALLEVEKGETPLNENPVIVELGLLDGFVEKYELEPDGLIPVELALTDANPLDEEEIECPMVLNELDENPVLEEELEATVVNLLVEEKIELENVPDEPDRKEVLEERLENMNEGTKACERVKRLRSAMVLAIMNER